MSQRAQQRVECCVSMYTPTHSKCTVEVSLSHDSNRHRLAGISFFMKKKNCAHRDLIKKPPADLDQ